MRQVVKALDVLNLAADGEQPRTIQSTTDLNLATVARYIAARPPGQSTWTMKGHLQILRTLCGTAVKARRLAVNPFDLRSIGRIVRPAPPRNKRALSRDETTG